MSRILLVDDEPNVSQALLRVLRRELGAGVTVEAFTDPRAALVRAEEISFDVVVSDYRMPGMDGLAFLTALRRMQPLATRIVLSGMTDFDVLMVAINEAGIWRFLPKPWEDAEFSACVRDGVAFAQRNREHQRLADEHRRGASETPVANTLPDSAARAELQRLEAQEPGITRVKWGPNGEVLLDD